MYDGGPSSPNRGGGGISFISILCRFMLLFFIFAAIEYLLAGDLRACSGELFLVAMEICFLRGLKFEATGSQPQLREAIYFVAGIILGLIGNGIAFNP